MKKIFFLTAPDSEYGFSLAGVTQYVTDEKDVESKLKKLLSRQDTGLVVMDERLL